MSDCAATTRFGILLCAQHPLPLSACTARPRPRFALFCSAHPFRKPATECIPLCMFQCTVCIAFSLPRSCSCSLLHSVHQLLPYGLHPPCHAACNSKPHSIALIKASFGSAAAATWGRQAGGRAAAIAGEGCARRWRHVAAACALMTGRGSRSDIPAGRHGGSRAAPAPAGPASATGAQRAPSRAAHSPG